MALTGLAPARDDVEYWRTLRLAWSFLAKVSLLYPGSLQPEDVIDL